MFTFGSTFLKESQSQYLNIGTLLLSNEKDNESIKSDGLFTQNPVITDFEISSWLAITLTRHVSH